MSDSASRKDVEDVLSSVRRLVSSEQPRNSRPELPKGPGALVLTDAQRVERPTSKGIHAKSLEDRIAELEAAVSTSEDEYEPDGSEDQAQHRPDRIVYTRPPSNKEEAELRGDALRVNRLTVIENDADTSDDASDEADVIPAVSFRHNRATSDDARPDAPDTAEEAPMAENVEPPTQEKAEVHAFHDPDAMVGRFEARMDGEDLPPPPGPGHNGFAERLEPYEAQQEAAQDVSADADEPAEAIQADAEVAEERADVLGDEIDEAEFEAALSEAVTLPAEAEVESESEPEPQEEVAKVEAEAIEPAPVSEETEPTTAPIITPEALADIDEDVLRPIVAKLIREELQGELGERITRNVRKLVRREILRAVNSREFE